MFKPGVSYSKKGAIINIIWLFIENPSNLTYFRITDIKNLLIEEFGIKLDRKTIMDYLRIINELGLPLNAEHVPNKGFLIEKKFLTPTERQILIDAIYDQKSIDMLTQMKLVNFVTHDLSKQDRKQYATASNKTLYETDKDNLNLSVNLSIIHEAINTQKSISFDYLNYGSNGKLLKESRRFTATPLKINYLNGMYYLYNSEKIWDNAYCGIKIKYMRNITIGGKVNNPTINEELDYSFKVDIIYNWSVELIKDFFDKYDLKRKKYGMEATIYAPFDYAVEWCKLHAQFFVIHDSRIEDKIRYDTNKLLNSFINKSPLVSKIKSGIVNYHYENSDLTNLPYPIYIKDLYKSIDYMLQSLSYNLISDDEIRKYQREDEQIGILFFDSFVVEAEEKAYKIFENKFNKLKACNEAEKILVFFYNDLGEATINKITDLIGNNPFLDVDDKFSKRTISYFYKYAVVVIK